MADVEIRRAGAHELDALIDLAGTSLGWAAAEPNAELFRWKHLDNPCGPSPMWVAVVDGRLAGFRTFLRWELRAPDATTHRVVRAVDTATHPDFQGRGVFTRLTRAALDDLADEGVSFVFNTPNDQSRPGYLKMGWVEVGRLPVAVRVNSPAAAWRMARARVPAEKWSQPVTVAEPAGAVFDDRAHADDLATLLAAAAPASGWCTRRTVAHLSWRYRFEPLHYRVLTAEGGLADGFVVFRLRRRGQAVECAVCEVVVPHADTDRARRLLARLCRETRPAGVDYWLRLGPPDLRAGWLPVPAQGPRLTVRTVTQDPPSDLAAWSFALGDIELF